MTRASLQDSLERGLAALPLSLPSERVARLLDFLDELVRWNKAYNLTAVRDPEEMVVVHLLDSLVVLPFLKGRRVIDVGTGAGLPGVPLAIADPARHYALLDPSAKRQRFLRHVVTTLQLGQAEPVRERSEDYRPAPGFDTVICRALAPLPRLLGMVGHLCGPGGTVLAMTGRRPDNQALAALASGWRAQIHQLNVPGLDARRHLVEFIPGR